MKKLLLVLALGCTICFGQNPYRFMGTYNKSGIPEYEGISFEKQDSAFITEIYSFLPERKSVLLHHPEYLETSVVTEMKLTGPTTLWVTFANESAGWNNTFGYYYYNEKIPAETAEDLEQVVVFPNVSTEAGLIPGTKVKLGNFKAGTVIGWFLVANGWQNGKVTPGNYTLYSNPVFNPESDPASKKHVVLLNSPSKKQFVLGFEDTRRDQGSDHDFNDVLFYVTLSNTNAVDIKNIPVIKERPEVVNEDKQTKEPKDTAKVQPTKGNSQKNIEATENNANKKINKNQRNVGNSKIVSNTTIVNNNYGNNNVNNANANTAVNTGGGDLSQKNSQVAVTDMSKKVEVQQVVPEKTVPDNHNTTTTNKVPTPAPDVCSVNGFTETDFIKTYNLIKSKPTDESRKSLMMQAIRARKISVDQTVRLLKLFGVQRYRLEMAKYIFDYSCEKKNYYLVSKIFDVSTYERDFDAWLAKQNLEEPQPKVSPVIETSGEQNNNSQERSHHAHISTSSCNGHVFNGSEFGDFRNGISSKSFSGTMKTVLKQGMEDRCIEVYQVKELMSMFSFETDKIEMAKFLYDFTMDKQNYYKVNDVFGFSSSVDELNDYLQNRK